MASLAATAVSRSTADFRASEFVGFQRFGITLKRLKLVLTGQGGATNTIPASALGFTTLLWCSNLYDKTNGAVYRAAVDPTTNTIVLAAIAGNAVADVTTTEAHIVIAGT
jgi:uncharacterized protein (DUF697 family)